MKELAEKICSACEDMDHLDFADTKEQDMENLERELLKAKELHLDCILEALGCLVS